MKDYFTCLLFVILSFFIGAVTHEMDMHNQYVKIGKLNTTAWVTEWVFPELKDGK